MSKEARRTRTTRVAFDSFTCSGPAGMAMPCLDLALASAAPLFSVAAAGGIVTSLWPGLPASRQVAVSRKLVTQGQARRQNQEGQAQR